MHLRTCFMSLVLLLCSVAAAPAQEMPADYAAVMKTLGKTGDFKGGVLKVNIPRTDLTVAIDGALIPTPLRIRWLDCADQGRSQHARDDGDLVLAESEVNPVMSAVLDAGLDVTALHNHFFYETPRIFYMHVHGIGAASELAAKIKPAIDLIGKTSALHCQRHRHCAADRSDGAEACCDCRARRRAERTGLQDHDRTRRHRRA